MLLAAGESVVAVAERLGHENAATALAFWARARAFFAGHGITVQRVLTDNGSAYKSHAWREKHQALSIRHCRIRPDQVDSSPEEAINGTDSSL